MTALQQGSQVFWWKRVGRDREYPYRAEVVSVGPKRVTIRVEDPNDASDRFTRHVTVESLQIVGRYCAKAVDQLLYSLEVTASWGRFTRYLEIGEDLWAVRRVDAFENGNLMSYDRHHWIDDFGMLGDAKINRNRKCGQGWHVEEIETIEFERVWDSARTSALWSKQMATAKMSEAGSVPIWLTRKGWCPSQKSR